MAELNLAHRGLRAPTDVLTFPAPASLPGGEAGEIVLCLEVVRRRASRFGLPWRVWLATLTVHGVLHALGFHHHDPASAARMFSLQRALARHAAR